MKKKVNLLSLATMMFIALSVILYSGCKKDDPDPVAPIASFQFVLNDTNSLEVSFTNYSKYASSYSWDFGDGIGTSTDENPVYTYSDGGLFNVTLTAFNEIGSKDHTKEVIAKNPAATNYIQNGGFDDNSIWEVLQHNPNDAGTISIENGVAVYNKGIQADWGAEPHVGMNQAVEVEAGTYQFDMDITTNGISDAWFEVWVGTEVPVANDDYNADDGATAVLVFNTWDCPNNSTYSGSMAAESCQGTDGSITLEKDIWYVVIRSGGLNFTDDGIVIDNVTMVKLD